MKQLAVVLLNFNGRHYLERFLPLVIEHSQHHEVIVVDNGSIDDSVPFLKEHFPQVELILLQKNYGFCGGYNRAIEQIEAEYIVLLNTDVEVTPNWISPILDLFEQYPNIKAFQPKILDFNRKEHFEYAGAAGGFIDTFGYPFCRGRIFETLEKDKGQYDNFTTCFWASGSSLFIERNTFLTLGGFDEDFFAHMEEIDLCWRIWNAGYQVGVCPESKVYHVGGGTLDKSQPKKTHLNFRNGLNLLLKNEPWLALLWKIPIRILLDYLAAVKFSFQSGPHHGLAILHAHLAVIMKIGITLKKRKQLTSKKKKSYPVYNGSIAQAYFFLGKKHYNQVNKSH